MVTLKEILDRYRLPIATGYQATLNTLDWAYSKVGLKTRETDSKISSFAKSLFRRAVEVPVIYMTSEFSARTGYVYNSCAAAINTVLALRSLFKAEQRDDRTIAKEQFFQAAKNMLCCGVDYLTKEYFAPMIVGEAVATTIVSKIDYSFINKFADALKFPVKGFIKEINVPTIAAILSPELVRKAFHQTAKGTDALLKKMFGTFRVTLSVPEKDQQIAALEQENKYLRRSLAILRLIKDQNQKVRPFPRIAAYAAGRAIRRLYSNKGNEVSLN